MEAVSISIEEEVVVGRRQSVRHFARRADLSLTRSESRGDGGE